MASGLAAALHSELGIDATLVEGHDGIYEVSVGDETVYSNQSQCSRGFPDTRELVRTVGQRLAIVPRGTTLPTAADDAAPGPACPLPGPDRPRPRREKISVDTVSGCGCGGGTSCC